MHRPVVGEIIDVLPAEACLRLRVQELMQLQNLLLNPSENLEAQREAWRNGDVHQKLMVPKGLWTNKITTRHYFLSATVRIIHVGCGNRWPFLHRHHVRETESRLHQFRLSKDALQCSNGARWMWEAQGGEAAWVAGWLPASPRALNVTSIPVTPYRPRAALHLQPPNAGSALAINLPYPPQVPQ